MQRSKGKLNSSKRPKEGGAKPSTGKGRGRKTAEQKAARTVKPIEPQHEGLLHMASFPSMNVNPIVEADLVGNIVYMNPAAKRLFADLVRKKLKHPYLADWNVVAGTFRKNKAASLNREATVGDACYQQNMQYIAETKTIRIYGHDVTNRKKAEEALRKNAEYYRGLFVSMTEGFALHEIICDKKGRPCDYRFLEINSAFETLTGLKRKNVIGKTVREILPDNDPQWIEIYGKVALTGEPAQFDSHSTPLNKDYEVYAYSPAPKQFAVLFTDITQRKKTEKELHQLNRTLRALSKSNQVMMKAVDEEVYLEAVCKLIIEDCGHKMAWIGYAEDDKNKSVRPVAYSGFEEGYLETLKLTWADTDRGRGPTGTAIRTGKVSMCKNMLTDPKFKPWRKEAIKRGYASSIVLPLKNVYKIFGALTIYSKEPDPFSDDEVKLLTELANDLAYGITMLRLHAAKMLTEGKLQESNEELAAINEELLTANEELLTTQDELTRINTNLQNEIEERKQAEKALRESEERFRAAFLRGSIAMAMSSLDYKLMKVNPAFCQMLGFTEAELINHHFTEITHPNDVAANLAGVQRIISGEANVFRMEKRYIRKDGSVIWGDMSTAAVRDAQGKAIYIVTHVQDITERKRAEEALKESQALLDAVMENTSDPVYVKDRQSRILMCNPALEKIVGKPAAQIIGKTDSEYYDDPAIGQTLRENDLRVMESGSGQTMEETAKTSDGYRVFLSSKAPYRDASGDIIGVIGISHDITERKQAEEALRESRERLDLALLSSRMATFDWDIIKNKRTWSNGVHSLLGTKPEAFTGTAEEFFQIIHPEDRSTVQAALAKALETGVYETEYRAVWPDGSIRHIAARGKVHRDSAGQVILMTGVCWDITEKKQAQDALQESEERLKRSQEIAHLGGWELDLINNRLTWSDEVYRIFGLEPQEFGATYEAFIERVHPDDRATVDEAYSGSLRDNRDSYEIEHRVIRKDTGEIRTVHEKCEHFRDQSGKIIRSVGMVHDITERKRAQTLLQTRMHLSELAQKVGIDELLQAVLDETEALTESQIGFFHFVNEDQESLTLQAWSSNTLKNMCKAEGKGQHYSVSEAGVWADCFRTREPVIHNDYASLPHKKGMPEGHATVVRELTVPILRGNSVVAIIGMGNKPHDYTQTDAIIVRDLVTPIMDIVARQQAEEEVRLSEERYRRLMQSIPVPLGVVNKQGESIYFNDRFIQVFGYTKADLPTLDAWWLHAYPDPAYRSQVRQNWEVKVKQSTQTQIETEPEELNVTCKDGTVRIVLISNLVIEDNILATFIDVTERKKAEEAIANERANLQTIFDAVDVGMLLVDEHGEVKRVNNAVARWISKDPNAVCGDQPGDVLGCVHALDDPAGCGRTPECKKCAIRSAFETVLRTGQAMHDVEAEAGLSIGGNKVRLWLEVSVDPVVIDGKRHVILAMNNITARKQAEEALRESEQRFRTLAETLPGIVWTASPDGVLDYFNTRYYEYTGIRRDADVKEWPNVVHPDDIEDTHRAWAAAVQTGKPYNIEHRVRQADGKYHWFLVRGLPIRSDEGIIVKWFGISTDIEKQKRTFEELERLHGELEGKNEELESIIRIASHDLRSPLVNIKGFSGELAKDIHKTQEMLKEVAMPEQIGEKINKVFGKYVPEAIGFIQNSADAINRMLANLMQVAKAGTAPMHIEELDMNALLARVAANVEFKIREVGGRIELETLPACRGDVDHLTQVFTNLIENAIKYRDPARSVEIRIYASTDDHKVIYCVEDNGKGIAAEFHEKIFNLFTRLDPEAAKGEGLGLTIAKRMIERKGGKIWVNSEVGKGSKFYVMLPR